MNGLPALLVDIEPMVSKQASRLLVRVDVDGHGKITDIHAVMADRKLAALSGS